MKIFIILIAILIIAAGAVYFFMNDAGTEHKTQPQDTAEESIEESNADGAGEVEMQYSILKEGAGKSAARGDTVSVHYTGWLEDDTKFDSSVDRGTPFQFILGAGQVIPGWDAGVEGMKKGEVRVLIIPPQLAYGASGVPGGIPPNATLIFNIEMLEITAP